MKSSPSLNLQQTLPLTLARSLELRDLQQRAREQSFPSDGNRLISHSGELRLGDQGGRSGERSFPFIQTLLGGLF